MFRPNKNIQIGGDYTNTRDLLDSTDLYGVLSQNNTELLQIAIDTPTRVSTLTAQYQSTVSSISTALSGLKSEYSTLSTCHISSVKAKQDAYYDYSTMDAILSNYSSAYINSSIIYSTYLSTLKSVSSYVSTSTGILINLSTCTWFSTCGLVQSGGQSNNQASDFDYLVSLSTIHGINVSQQISTIYNVNIPNIRRILSTYSTQYIFALSTYNSVESNIQEQRSLYQAGTSTLSTLNGKITDVNTRINQTRLSYENADRRIRDDDAIIIYKNALKNDTDTYTKYNSTMTTMRQIENVYNLVMKGLPVPTELLNAMPMQGGGLYTDPYTPTYKISSFTCNPGDTVCNAKLSQLNTYITAYFSLSTALNTYSQNYETAHQARRDAEVNTPLRLNTNLQTTLDNLDQQLKNAEQDIQNYTDLLEKEKVELSILYGISSSLTVSLPKSLFTTDELADLVSYGNAVQNSGTSMLERREIRQNNVEIITCGRAPYNASTIKYYYSSQIDTYNASQMNNDERYASLQHYYMSSLAAYQVELNNNFKKDIMRDNIETERTHLERRLESNIEAVSSLTRRISSISSAINNNNINTIMGSDAVTVQNNERRAILTSYRASTLHINSLLSTYYNVEMNFYMDILGQISSYIIQDSALQENDIYANSLDNNAKSTIYIKIDNLTDFLVKTESYMTSITNEQYYKKLYLDTKNIYEIEEGILASGIDQANNLPKDILDQITVNYDINVAQINDMVTTRRRLNNTYTSTISTMLKYITPGTHYKLYNPVINSPNTSPVTLLPYTMNFEYISTRTSLFNKADTIPQAAIPTCPPGAAIDGTPQTTTTLVTPTTTLNTRIYGTQGRYVRITKTDNNFEILQVIVIDSKGKNVAFQKPVEITPFLMASNRRQYITNGTYSRSSNFQPPIGINGSGGYVASINNTSALGTITCDPINKQIYVFNSHTQTIQKVSNDLKTITNFTQCVNCVNACISAYNQSVYVIDSTTQSFFSINSLGQRISIQTNLNINNPAAISNVHNNLIYITCNTNSNNTKTILSYNILNGNTTTNVIAKSGGLEPGATMNISMISNIGGIVVSSNGIIYVVDNGLRIISLVLSTNTVSVLAGSNMHGGYVDDVGTNARFNGINGICIDSENNLFVTEFSNNAIRKIDTLSGNVTTYITDRTGNFSPATTRYTNYPSLVPNVIASVVNTTPSYMSHLNSICFSGSNIYTTSYNNSNGHSSSYPFAKNATPNTWITSIPYSSYGGTLLFPSLFSSTETSSTPVEITIDLGAVVDITAIQYLKNSTSYSPVGLKFSILDSNRAPVKNLDPISVNLSVVNFDLRKSDLSPSELNTVPVTFISRRDGVCGPLGRYIKLSNSGNYYYAISQISIITTDGTNLAVGAKIFASMGNTNMSANASLIINGTYNSLPESNSFVYSSTNTNDYIIIDLGAEHDISAINLYYARETPSSRSIQNSATISILTADMQVSLTRQTSQYHTTMVKEVIDFRSNPSCPLSVKWSPFYGTAGIIARYIRVHRAGQMAFSKLEVIDRTGLDVAQFLRPSVASGSTTALNALTNVRATRLKSLGYLSDTSSNQYFIVDLKESREICAINLYGCTDIDLMLGLTISLYSNDPFISTSVPLITYSASPNVQIQRFDTRYEPTVSNYPTTMTRTLSKYGSFGVYAEKVIMYSDGLVSVPLIIDAAGNSISFINYQINTSTDGKYMFTFTLSRMYEITSVLINVQYQEIIVELYDCYNMLVASSLTYNNSIDSGLYAGHSFADFRNFLNNQRNPYAPIIPWSLKRGGYRLGADGRLLATNPYTNSGVKARYVKIIPRDPLTPLYLSQILAVDEFGINRAFQKQTFHMNETNRSAPHINFPNDGKNAVDGVYEAQIDNIEFLQLFFTKYKRKTVEESYKSYIDPVGTTTPNSYAFYIDLELDQTTDPSMMNLSNGREYSINSIIYVTSKDRGSEAEGVIIQLLDDKLNIVGSQQVTRMAHVFGLDILDFRPNITVSMNSIPNRVEVRERIVHPGPEGKGVLTQYIRVEQTQGTHPIKLSHIIATDTTSHNVAMFKPTYSSSNNLSSFLVVDGTNYIKNQKNTFTTTPSSNEYQYVEVNLEKEYELINLKIGDVFGSSEGFSTLRVRLYNKDRDVIGSHAKFVPATIKTSLGYTGTNSPTIEDTRLDTNNFMYLNKIGVSIADNLTAYKLRMGLMANASVSSFSTINNVPSLLAPLNAPDPTTNNIIISQRYTRVNGGIPTRYVRLYNVGQYIQVSQLMVYDTTGVNVAYKKPAYATSILPNNYAAYATDGYGGFFHIPRDEQNCFISGNRRYDYLEIDLISTFNIIAVRYIPPPTNRGRNLGVRIQLLDSNRNHLIEKVVTAHGDMILDYRIMSASNPPIYEMISPKISKVSNLLHAETITGFFIRPYNIGNPSVNVLSFVYASPAMSCIHAMRINNGAPIKITRHNELYSNLNNTRSIMGIHCTENGIIYVADYFSNRINAFSVYSEEYLLVGRFTHDDGIIINTGITNPYSLVKIGNILYVSENRIGGKIYSYNDNGQISRSGTLSSPLYTNDYIGSITTDWDNNLLFCVGSTKQVIRLTLSNNSVSVVAGPLGSSTSCIIPLQFPSGIAVDKINRIIFVSDVLTNQIYAIRENSNTGILIAGTGVAGNSGDGAQGAYAKINGPFFLQYYQPDGCLYFADKNNNSIRKIDMQTSAAAQILTTTTNPPAFNTTTIPATSAYPGTTQARLITRPETNDTYVSVINRPTAYGIISRSGIYDAEQQIYCFTIPFNNYLFYYYSGNLYRVNTNEIPSVTPTTIIPSTQIATYNIGVILSTTSNNVANLLYIASNTRRIYRAEIGNLGNSPITHCGTGVQGYSPDGTSALLANIIPFGTTFNKITNELYFSDCQPECGLVRKINSSNTLQTIAGLYTPNRMTVNPNTYYNFIEDTVRPEANPLAINLLNPVAILTDYNGYTYIADSDTCCIHRITPDGALQPVCGPFRNTPNSLDFFNNYAIDIDYPAYSVKIKSINSITFDGNMNLICTSLNGCQIICISNLDRVEPTARVICGLGVNVDNLKPHSNAPQISKYFNIRSPRSICYSYDTNALYFVIFDYSQCAICTIRQPYNSIIYNGQNRMLPYGTANLLETSINSGANMCIDINETIYYTDITNKKIKKRLVNGTITNLVETANFTPGDLCIYNNTDIYYINTVNKSINKCNINTGVIQQSIITDTEVPTNIDIFENGYIILSYTNSIKVVNINHYAPVIYQLLSGNVYGPICINKKTNKIYITTNTNNTTTTITEYKTNFQYNPSPPELITIRPDPSNGSTMSGPLTNIICDPAGNRYISNSTTVYLIYRDQTLVASKLEGFSNPKSMHWHNNNLYVADTDNNRIRKIDTTAGNLNNVTVLQSPVPNFSSPSGVFVNSTDVYIADTGNNRICKYNINNRTYSYIQTTFIISVISDATKNISPIGIVVDPNNTIFYTGIQEAYGNMNETYGLYSYTTKNTILDNVQYRLGQITLDNSTNTLYVMDTNGRIINYTKNGSKIQNIIQTPPILAYCKYGNTFNYINSSSLYSFILTNAFNIEFSKQWIIPITSSSLRTKYITAYNEETYCIANNNIYKLISDGTFKQITGLKVQNFLPTSPMMINLTNPSCIKMTESGSIYIADSTKIIKIDNQQKIDIQYIYSIAGDTKFDGNSGNDILGSSALLNTPTGTCFDSKGNIYIGDSGNKCVRRIDAITGIITTVASNIAGAVDLSNIVDVKVDGTGALYILTSTKLYRSTANTLTTFNTPVLIAGNSSNFLDGGYAVNSSLMSLDGRTSNLPTARSMCIDGFGNIYVAYSVAMTQILSNSITSSSSSSLSTARNALYGSTSSTIPIPPTGGSSKADYDVAVSLYGTNGGNPSTDGNPSSGSLQFIRNVKLNNIGNKQTINSNLDTLSSHILIYQGVFTNIRNIFQTRADSVFNRFTYSQANVNTINQKFKDDLSSIFNTVSSYINYNNTNITLKHSYTLYIEANDSLRNDVLPYYTNVETYLTRANTIRNMSVTALQQVGRLYEFIDEGKNFLNDLKGFLNTTQIQNTITSAKSTAQTAYNTALIEYYGSTNTGQILSPGALFNYNQKMIERYGQTTYTPTPTSGTLFNYNRDYNALQTATTQNNNIASTVAPTQAQIDAVDQHKIGRIVKIDMYGVIRTYAVGIYECTGITCDSAGNLYIVEYYKNKIYKIPANYIWQQGAIWDLTPIINTGVNKPYGIALDTNNNLWISYNANDVKYLTPNAQAHKILKYNYNTSNNTYELQNTSQIGTGNPASDPYTKYYGNVINPELSNPANIAIDKNNRLIFTQTGLHSVLLTALTMPSTTVNNIKSIRIEAASIGRRVCLNAIDINPSISSQRTITTNGTATALPYSSNINDINPFINFSFTTPISFNSLTLTANLTELEAVGMKVLLFDSTGTLISNRITTTDILTTNGCKIYYDTVTLSKS